VKSVGDLGPRGMANKIVQGVGKRCRVKTASVSLAGERSRGSMFGVRKSGFLHSG
jgi:hypothetical protein